ncbi:hypothetical protein CBR_g40018 [Chara braunii]|uniref:RNA-directed DNA polymerase n=1 Tax=Chara braunii TaxID=69332 RepID=A0A388LSY7_CHABU|nr:hypothetical protein CBR_g40018 [Chara braunii]|eukprot:GBG85375.1 hypothetical protein CBR_g40018 [Chara braunii]
MPEEMADGGKKLVMLDDLIDALDKRERAPSNVPKVDTFHFKRERVSDWLDLTEQALVGLSDEVKLQRVLRYVLHSHHQEKGKVVDAANGSWARFKDMMQRKYRLGDGLLTMADLEAMNKEDFSTIGVFVHEFKKKARKVHGISEETQCAIFLGVLTGSEASELTGHGGGKESNPEGDRTGDNTDRSKEGEEEEEGEGEPATVLLGRMEDLLEKVGRYQRKLQALCEEAREWEANLLEVFLYDSGIEPSPGQQGYPKVVTVGTGPRSVDLVIKNQKCTGMVDTGAKMNIIREKEAVMIDMEIDRSDHGMLHGANCKAAFCGTASNVIIEIGKVRARTCFFVMPDVDRPILVGRSFLCRTKMLIFNKHDGTMILLLCDPACGNYEVVTCRNTGPGSGRNRSNLGSFTFEESENERRRLWKVPEEEDKAEVLTLSLTDVNKAMEVVSAHDMADPEAIKALREQVLENLQVGEVELVYRLPRGGGGPAMAQARTTNKKCRLVPVLVTEDEEVYYERERGLIRRMREHALAGPCRINDENEGKLIIGEPDFLSPQERALMVGLMKKRHRAYAFNDDERGRLDVDKIPMIRIHTIPHEPWNLRGERYPNPDEEKKVVDHVDGKMRTHVADYSSRPYASPWFCFIKPNGTLTWVQDLQRLNAVTVQDAGGLPNADALSESCAGRPIISLIDLYFGYDQFPVYPPDRPVTTMHTPRGLIHMNVAPQGWTNAVVVVQRHMIRAMQTVSPHITQPYIDDLAVKGPKEKEDEVMPGVRRFVWKHVQDIDQVLGLLEEHNLTTSGPKLKHYMREATILGFVCNESGRRSDVKKTDKILEWSVPFRSITNVRSFLGMCGFWRSFVKDFATKTEHLRKLVRQDQEWVWGEDQEEAVGRMKGEFKEGGLVLGAPNYEATEERPFVIETETGPTALGGVLIQADTEGKERPLRFESRTLNTTERNYSQFKKETLAVLHCLRTFRNYVFGRRLILRVDPTALACSLKNYTPSDPTVARWLTYIWMFNFELERVPGNKNRADGLSRINWDGLDEGSIEDAPPVDGFLDQEEDVRLHINEWSLRVPSCVSHPIWLAPKGYEQKEKLVLKPFQEEDPWGSKDVGWMMKLALARTYSLVEEMRMIEESPSQVEEHEQLMGGMYLLANTLLQGDFDRMGSFGREENEILVPESQDDEFEEGEIKEAFRVEEYDGIYRELGLLLSCEMRDRDASAKAQKMRHLYLVRDGHLFIKRQVGNPKRIVCGRNRQIDIIAALHDDIAGGHRGVGATCVEISELYHWDGMLTMIIKYCRSDFSKTAMQRGGRDVRPRQRPQGASGGDDSRRPSERESTPVFNDDNIELFLDSYQAHAAREGWSTLERIRHLRGVGRFEEPIVHIREEALTWQDVEARMQMLRASSLGPDGLPIRLEEGNLGANQSGPTRYEPVEDEPEEEPPEPGPEARSRGTGGPQTEGVITVGDDTPPPTPIPEQVRQYWPEGIPEPDSEEMLGPPSEATMTPPTRAGPEEGERARTPTTVAPQLTEPTGARMDMEVPTPGEPPPGLPPTEEGTSERDPQREAHEARTRRPSGETKEEKRARVQATAMTIEVPGDKPAQRPQPPEVEGGLTEESPTILLEVQEGALTGAAASTEPGVMGGKASRLNELVAALELDMSSGGTHRQETPERVPEIGELRTQLGSWATGADSGEHISEQQQEVMSEPVTSVTPQPSDLHRGEGATAMGGVREGRPLRLDNPAYQPEEDEMLAGPSTQMMEAGPTESWSMPQSHEMSRETSETPPLPGSQKKKRRCRGRSDDQCFFCKDDIHRALECPKFLKDKAAGRVTKSGGRIYDRQGRMVERAPDGGRAQLYRQNQEAMSE